MTIFDTIRYPISHILEDEELDALPEQLFLDFAKELRTVLTVPNVQINLIGDYPEERTNLIYHMIHESSEKYMALERRDTKPWDLYMCETYDTAMSILKHKIKTYGTDEYSN